MKKFLVLALLAVMTCAVALPALAYYDNDVDFNSPSFYGVVDTPDGGTVIIRNAPIVDSSTFVGRINDGTTVNLRNSISYSNTWYRIYFQNAWCFIMKTMVDV